MTEPSPRHSRIVRISLGLGALGAVLAGFALRDRFTDAPRPVTLETPNPVISEKNAPTRHTSILPEKTEKFGPPLPTYPALEPGGDVYPAFMDRKDEKRFDILLKVIAKKNDNDPRLDRDLKNLTPALKSAIAEEYFQRRPEDRNAKGTLVFLIGRELATESDLEFLKLVLEEAPCLSLVDCAETAKAPVSSHAHSSDGQELTLAYPQRVAVLWLEKAWKKAPRGPLAAKIRGILEEVRESSPVPLVRDAARSALSRMK